MRKKAKAVKEITPDLRQLLSSMSQIMYDCAGIGLAAPQIGIDKSVIVVDAGGGLYKLINPKIVKKEGSYVLEEGCLSIPDVSIKVKRAKKIKLAALDEFGKPVSIEAQDLLACVFQHEIDHLKGRLIIDYASFFEKLRIRKKLEELKRRRRVEGLPKPETKYFEL